MKSIIDWLNKPFAVYPTITERLVYLLIFLFPVAGMSVRHWITNIFNLLVLIALFSLRKPRAPLLKQEKIFLWICSAYFSMFIISSLANGWGQQQTYYLGTELRFLMVIPLYLLLRRYSDCDTWLLRGAILGGFFLFGQAYFDIYIMGNRTALGIYSKNLIGPFAVLTGYWSIFYAWKNFKNINQPEFLFIMLSIIAAFITAGLSGSRGSYVGFLFTGIACIIFISKPRWIFSSLLVISLVTLTFYQSLTTVKKGVDQATNGVKQYMQAENHTKDISSTTSTGIRLEMLRTGMLLIKDNPLTGIGPGNYNKTINQYINSGKANPILKGYSYPHNAFLEAASAKGLFGLLTILLLFYYPAFLFMKHFKICKPTAVLGLLNIITISVFSITDHSVIVMNNYTSILLLGIAVFLSSHFRCINKL